ncbi:MAG: tRNA (adenosine(37)-N6)-threonylcarbamoyltransferase complex dimerization subunit type 1 TsaB [Lentisphaerae bacterium]|jgi:tRNA threonylcarbamoyl adenosine modification protein YeaZ|nr:tRNA (adenosine(37)-N6)-threonylcarbamoyltransferase complex dimerization subunit type 1 TsaB [Lentisphaerota bacterium]
MLHAALDTSIGSSFAVADGSTILFNTHLQTPARDSDRELAPWLIGQLAEHNMQLADIRRWTIGIGPGSFSGLRFGIAFLKGVVAVTGAELRGVPSSQALADAAAEHAGSANRVGVLHDARCSQVILTVYERKAASTLKLVAEPAILQPEQLLLPEYACDAWTTAQPELLPSLPKRVAEATFVQPFPDASRLLQAQDGDAACEPVYVRPPVFVSPQPIRKP